MESRPRWRSEMKAFLAGIVVMVVVSVGAWAVLDQLDYAASDVFSSEQGSVRLD